MKDKNPIIKLEQPEQEINTKESADEKQSAVKRGSFAVFIIVLLLFLGIMVITYIFELKFGKTAGTAAMVVVALLIAVYLYRNEIKEKLSKKKQDGKK